LTGPQGIPGYVALTGGGTYSPTTIITSPPVFDAESALAVWRRDGDIVQVDVLIALAVTTSTNNFDAFITMLLPVTRTTEFTDTSQAPGVTQVESSALDGATLVGRVDASVGFANSVTLNALFVGTVAGETARVRATFLYSLV
jgi:hypothetical protein